MSTYNLNEIITNIKQEETWINNSEQSTAHRTDNNYEDDDHETHELYNSVLIENLDSNETVKNDINRFLAEQAEKKNRKNLINYCGILDPTSETEGCARVSSIYVPKFGKSHIKSKLITKLLS